ncbi:MAG TPA: methyltransferase domain-containing protein [Ktedonobacterales bacterium]|nr:methyltransferase domain-containing protein [Ktedonobacterales bacterium]
MTGDELLGPHGHERSDDTPDAQVYETPRMVAHIDETAITETTAIYRQILAPIAPGGRVLDLMSSRYSHLPDDLPLAEVVGLGMNTDELAENPQLTSWVVHDLNVNPQLPFDDESFDAALNTVSVQYLQQPVAVFAAVARVLRPGAPHAVVFSHRCFPTKAIRAWLERNDEGHVALVSAYFEATALFEPVEVIRHPGHPARWPWESSSDPLYAVIGRRADKGTG